MCGVYPDADVKTAGDEFSSTYEGRHVTLLASELTHAGAVVTKGLPVVFGDACGVAFVTEVAGTDLIPVDTEGIWIEDVVAADDNGNSAVVPGDRLYINTTTCVISKIRNTATQIPFGYALGSIDSGNTNTIAVKVHQDPSLDTNDQMFKTVTSGAYSYGKQWVGLLEAGQSTGVAGYFCAQVDGQQTGGIYGWGAWMEIQAGFLHKDDALLVGGEFGIYDGGGDIDDNWVVLCQLQGILASAPSRIDIFRVNVAAAGGTVHSIIAAANPTSVGYIAAVTEVDAPVGYVPMFDIVGHGVRYVRLYADTD